MEIIQRYKHGKLTEHTCSICLENIREKQIKDLPCKHKLHIDCYDAFMTSNCLKQCPTCRIDLVPQNGETRSNLRLSQLTIQNIISSGSINCSVCNQTIDLDESACDIVYSNQCRCFFHFDCVRFNDTINCQKCRVNVSRESLDALSYLYFETGYKKWVGKIPKCKITDCKNISNPKRHGYCREHCGYIMQNSSIIITLQYFVKYVKNTNEIQRQKIFELVSEYVNRRFPDVLSRDIDIKDIHRFMRYQSL